MSEARDIEPPSQATTLDKRYSELLYSLSEARREAVLRDLFDKHHGPNTIEDREPPRHVNRKQERVTDSRKRKRAVRELEGALNGVYWDDQEEEHGQSSDDEQESNKKKRKTKGGSKATERTSSSSSSGRNKCVCGEGYARQDCDYKVCAKCCRSSGKQCRRHVLKDRLQQLDKLTRC